MNFNYNLIGNGIGFGNILESILKSRGVINPKEFLNLGDHNIEDFHLYDNMSDAVKCIHKHIMNDSVIALIVDFDLDGYTSSTEIYLYLNQLCLFLL